MMSGKYSLKNADVVKTWALITESGGEKDDDQKKAGRSGSGYDACSFSLSAFRFCRQGSEIRKKGSYCLQVQHG